MQTDVLKLPVKKNSRKGKLCPKWSNTLLLFYFYSSNEYLSKDIGQIPIDERFIYKYLKDTRSRKTEDPASDDESVNSEDFNEALNADMNERDLDFASNIENLDDDLDDQGDDEDSNEGM